MDQSTTITYVHYSVESFPTVDPPAKLQETTSWFIRFNNVVGVGGLSAHVTGTEAVYS